ncbi:MAG: hypothetical protein ACSHWU_12965 [Marinicella sp.]
MNIKSKLILGLLTCIIHLNSYAAKPPELPNPSACWDQPELAFCPKEKDNKLKYDHCINQCDIDKSLCIATESDPLTGGNQDLSMCEKEYNDCKTSCNKLYNKIKPQKKKKKKSNPDGKS